MKLTKRSVLRKRLEHVLNTVPPSMWDCADEHLPGDPLQIALNTSICSATGLAGLVQTTPEYEVREIVRCIDECHDLSKRAPYKAFEGSKVFAQRAAFTRLRTAVAAL